MLAFMQKSQKGRARLRVTVKTKERRGGPVTRVESENKSSIVQVASALAERLELDVNVSSETGVKENLKQGPSKKIC